MLTLSSGLTDLDVSTAISSTMVAISFKNSFADETRAVVGSDAFAVPGSSLTASYPAPFFLTTSFAFRTMASKR